MAPAVAVRRITAFSPTSTCGLRPPRQVRNSQSIRLDPYRQHREHYALPKSTGLMEITKHAQLFYAQSLTAHGNWLWWKTGSRSGHEQTLLSRLTGTESSLNLLVVLCPPDSALVRRRHGGGNCAFAVGCFVVPCMIVGLFCVGPAPLHQARPRVPKNNGFWSYKRVPAGEWSGPLVLSGVLSRLPSVTRRTWRLTTFSLTVPGRVLTTPAGRVLPSVRPGRATPQMSTRPRT